MLKMFANSSALLTCSKKQSSKLHIQTARVSAGVEGRAEVQHLRCKWFCLLKDLNPLSPVCSDITFTANLKE